MDELEDELHDRIVTLCAEGDLLTDDEDFPAALEKYWAAWNLLPQPRTDWEAAPWILAAVGDANFFGGDFEAGREHLTMALCCSDGTGHPFLHLRLGQCQFQLGNLDLAAEQLALAYMGAGKEIFAGEEEYFAFLKTRLDPPIGGWENLG